MSRRRVVASLAFVLGLAVLALARCAGPDRAAPGHDGPVPSPEGQAVLTELSGKTVTDGSSSTWTIGPFSVTPYVDRKGARTKGPHVDLVAGTSRRALPVQTDADVADLYQRVTGRARPELARGEITEEYRAALR